MMYTKSKVLHISHQLRKYGIKVTYRVWMIYVATVSCVIQWYADCIMDRLLLHKTTGLSRVTEITTEGEKQFDRDYMP